MVESEGSQGDLITRIKHMLEAVMYGLAVLITVFKSWTSLVTHWVKNLHNAGHLGSIPGKGNGNISSCLGSLLTESLVGYSPWDYEMRKMRKNEKKSCSSDFQSSNASTKS